MLAKLVVLRVLASCLLLTSLPALAAQEKPTTVKGKVKIGFNSMKLEAGHLYRVQIDGFGFAPLVSIRPGYFVNSETLNQGDTFQAFVLPTETKDHKINIIPNVNDDLDGSEYDYTLTITPIPLAEKPVLEEKGKLTGEDPKYKHEEAFGEKDAHKAYPIQLKARQVYIIEMRATAGDLDPFLFLEGPGNKLISRDDDGGSNTSARIFVQPRRTAEYRIIATAASNELGDFTLTVRTTDQSKK